MWTHVVGRLKFCFRPLILVDILAVLALHPLLRGLRALRMLRLVRTAIGPLELGTLKKGAYRHLTPQEKDALQSA